MALTLKSIQSPIAQEMTEFEDKFRDFMKSRVYLLDKIMSYIVKRKGKQMRPMFVFFSAGATGTITEKTHRGAALIELLHRATLVHDDVVDDSNYRRGFFSINALWKNKIAVLVGDYLLSRGLLLSIDHDDFDLLKLVSEAVREMSEGELLQLEKARRLDITEDIYYEVIRQKTASLIASCCAVGAQSAGAPTDVVTQMSDFGEKIGMAFQIKDDLFDYGTQEIGKPLGIDIKEKKMTLPLIHSLQNASKSEKRHIKNLIKNHSHKNAKVQEVIRFVKDKGGLQYATEVMDGYFNEAMGILAQLPESNHRDSLKDLVQFTIERNR
ncbi:MAG TPA: polyprenyl synthetase [Cytophagales bacterium]|nr:polyprenyl synthetase [Cytophagales bacterium]